MKHTEQDANFVFEDELDQFSASAQRYWGHRSKRLIVTVAIQLGCGSIIANRPLSVQDAKRIRDTLDAAISKAEELEREIETA